MNRRTYMKKEALSANSYTTEELLAKFANKNFKPERLIKFGFALFAVIICGVIFSFINANREKIDSDITISYVPNQIAAAGQKKDLISIPSGTVKANPFVPYRNIDGIDSKVSDVPQFELVAPPEILNTNSDAARVMDTTVSGILYDRFSPSAILNIEGNDYLVKKGDVVNNYKVLDIAQDSVSVKLGKNTFKAGIGEVLTEGSINYNDVSNLNKKFGGER